MGKALIWFTTTDGKCIESIAKDAAGIARMLSEQGRLADWKANPDHPDHLAAESAITSYRKYLSERKFYRRINR